MTRKQGFLYLLHNFHLDVWIDTEKKTDSLGTDLRRLVVLRFVVLKAGYLYPFTF